MCLATYEHTFVSLPHHHPPPSPPPRQGTFGELPTAAADQLGVVRACAYHLLNMINQLRDCMRMLHGGEPDGNLGRVQLSNAIEEVRGRGPSWRWRWLWWGLGFVFRV